ncbi:hypothetical protein AB0M67_34185, partial [Streptomyces sp. NPDC051662]
MSATVYQTVLAELTRRTPQQLTDRVERRWYGRWARALRDKDEDGRLRWSADEIALQLLASAACPVAQCEDGMLHNSDQACQQCRLPEHRFIAATGSVSSDRTRKAALATCARQCRPARTEPGPVPAAARHVFPDLPIRPPWSRPRRRNAGYLQGI